MLWRRIHRRKQRSIDGNSTHLRPAIWCHFGKCQLSPGPRTQVSHPAARLLGRHEVDSEQRDWGSALSRPNQGIRAWRRICRCFHRRRTLSPIPGGRIGSPTDRCDTNIFVTSTESMSLCHILGQWLAIPSVMDGESCPKEYRESWISHHQNANTSLSRDVTTAMYAAVEWDCTSDLRYAAISQSPLSAQPR